MYKNVRICLKILKNARICVRPPAHARLAKSYVILFVLVPAKSKTSFFHLSKYNDFLPSYNIFLFFFYIYYNKNFFKNQIMRKKVSPKKFLLGFSIQELGNFILTFAHSNTSSFFKCAILELANSIGRAFFNYHNGAPRCRISFLLLEFLRMFGSKSIRHYKLN